MYKLDSLVEKAVIRCRLVNSAGTTLKGSDRDKKSQQNDEVVNDDTTLKVSAKSPRILLVEDNEMVQMVHCRMLKSLNYTYASASSGKEALMFFEQENPDLILLDIGLPDINGFEVCKIIRNHQKGRHLPIIALTAYGEIVKEECLQIGFNAVVTKPIIFNEIQKLILHWLPKLIE